MQKSYSRRAFTLIELLVVISIIAILMSILLPAIRKTFTVAGQGMCAKQLNGINQAFHAYGNEFMEKIPIVIGRGNRDSWFATDIAPGGASVPVGLGCLWDADLIADYEMLFCPDGEGGGGEGWPHRRGRENNLENFPTLMDNRDWAAMVDYSMGYFSADSSTGYGAWPQEIVVPNDTLENLQEASVTWLADTRGWMGEVGANHYTTHGNYSFINFANVDGSTRSVVDVIDKKPTQQDFAAEDVPPWHDGWFHNGRHWLFWHWYAPGHGF